MKITIANTNAGTFMLQFRDANRLIVETIAGGAQSVIDIQDMDAFVRQMSVFGMRKFDDLRDPSAYSGLWYRDNGVMQIEHLKDAQEAQLGAKLDDVQQAAAAVAQITETTAAQEMQAAGLPVPQSIEMGAQEIASDAAPDDSGEPIEQSVKIDRKRK
jgi:hypothetical protein